MKSTVKSTTTPATVSREQITKAITEALAMINNGANRAEHGHPGLNAAMSYAYRSGAKTLASVIAIKLGVSID